MKADQKKPGQSFYEKWWEEYGKLAAVDAPYYTFAQLPKFQQIAWAQLEGHSNKGKNNED